MIFFFFLCALGLWVERSEKATIMKGTAHHALKALDIFQDFHGRRFGIIKALTTDFREFYQQCDPEEGEQCLVGLPNGTWEVKPPARMVSPDHPRPVSGFHFGRNRMPGQVWAATIAARWDLWLLTFALYFDGRSLPKRDREELFQRINELPTVCETVMEFGASKDQSAMRMLKKPKSRSTVNMPSPHKGESGAAMEDGHNYGSSSYGQNKSSETYVNSFSDDSRALKDESGAAIEDGHNDGSSSYGRSKFFVMYVNSSVDDSRGLKDDSGAAIEDGHNDGSGSSGQSKSSGMHVNSSVDESGAQKDGIGAAIEGGHNDRSSSYAQSKSSRTYVNSSDDDARTQTDESGAAIGDGPEEGSSNYGLRKSSGTHVSSSDDDSRDSLCFQMG